MANKNIKPIIMSALSALALGAVGTAGTFALFTDKADTTINIESGKVDLSTDMSIVGVWEFNGTASGLAVSSTAENDYINSIGGTTKIEDGKVKLGRWAPGDRARIQVTGENKSNIKTKVRLRAQLSGELAPALVMRVYNGNTWETQLLAATGNKNVVTDWVDMAAFTNPSGFGVEVSFPDHDGGEIKFGDANKDNQYQNTEATLILTYEVVQANADVSSSLLDQANRILAANEVAYGMNKNMYEALGDLDASLKTQILNAGYEWGVNEDQFFDFGALVPAKAYQYFKPSATLLSNYSTYAYNWTGSASVELNGVGFDAGDETGFTSIHYTNSGAARTNVIRTNGGDLVVNAPNDTIRHYGDADSADIQAIYSSSYHENGKVKLLAVKEGHVKLEGDADVNGIYVYNDSTSTQKDNSFKDIKITVEDGIDVPTLSRSAVEIADEGTKVCTVVTDQAKDLYLFNEGIYEQIKTVDEGKPITDNSATWADDSAANSDNTQNAAHQLANEFNGTYDSENKIENKSVVVEEEQYTVVFNYETREFETYEGTVVSKETQVVVDSTATEAAQAAAQAIIDAAVAQVSTDSGKTAEEATHISDFKGSGTQEDPWLIVDYDTFQSVSDHYYDNEFHYWRCKDNLVINAVNWTPVKLYGAIEGNGVVLNNLDNVLFNYAWNDRDKNGVAINTAKISNMTLNCSIFGTSSASGLINTAADDLLVDNVDIHGQIVGYSVGGYVNYGSGNFGSADSRNWQATFKNCDNDAQLVSFGEGIGGFVQHPFSDVSQSKTETGIGKSLLTIIDSAFTGRMVSVSNMDYFAYQGNHVHVKTSYSESFLEKLGYNPEGILYPNVNENESGVFDSGNYPASGHVACVYRPNDTTDSTYKLKITNKGSNPENLGDVYSFIKAEGAVTAKVAFMVSPNEKTTESGSYTATYMNETLDIASVEAGSAFQTSQIRYWTIAINPDGVTETGVVGTQFNIVNDFYGKTHNGSNIYSVQYDANGKVVGITSVNVCAANGVGVKVNGSSVRAGALGESYTYDAGFDLANYDVCVYFIQRDSTWYTNTAIILEDETLVLDEGYTISGSKITIKNIERRACYICSGNATSGWKKTSSTYGIASYNIAITPKSN